MQNQIGNSKLPPVSIPSSFLQKFDTKQENKIQAGIEKESTFPSTIHQRSPPLSFGTGVIQFEVNNNQQSF